MRKSTALSQAIGIALAGSSINALSVAYAQEQQPAAASDEVPAVVVTGSRIKQSTYTSSAPMDVIVPEAAAAQGVSGVSQLLQSTTVAAGSQQVTAATSTAFVQNGGIGAETLSLRGLGANRTLTLLNGRRAGPAGTRGGVSSFDLNVIPLSAIDRIEVLKDGASSIYGSDAVAGVVNIITKKSNGVTLDAYTSQPAETGGAETRVSASFGHKFERGNFRITGDYHKQSELTNGNRSYFRCGEDYIFDPTSGNRADIVDPRTSRPHCTDLL
ncbi:MAG: TonB-dependent receptor plug domain-containing protein, partial [Steroidobacteraceae bacterium]